MRKNDVILAMSAALLAACSNDVALDSAKQSAEVADNAIGFQFINRNTITSRAEGSEGGESTQKTELLNKAGHYNFGVFAYKLSGASAEQVMDNYLVGYSSPDNEETKYGYQFGNDQTTLASSRWAYEKLGSSDYKYSGSDGYYKQSDTFYMSNKANQYLKYWDKSSTSVDFFGYAPYINGNNTATFDNSKHTLTFPVINDGYDDASKYDYLYAYTNVAQANYNKEVQLNFRHLCAMVQIAFYEEIEGYSVKILNLQEANEDGTAAIGVSAAPAKKKEEQTGDKKYEYGTLYKTGNASVAYSNAEGGTWPGSGSSTITITGTDKYLSDTKDHLTFEAPSAEKIGTSKTEATYSPTKYYLIPDNEENKSGLTFHVTYQLTAEDTNETITVYNATVHVPYWMNESDGTSYCNWLSNHAYTYFFKITKGTSGSTDKPGNIDPSDPEADDSQALSPIIFDNCVVVDWNKYHESEHEIN